MRCLLLLLLITAGTLRAAELQPVARTEAQAILEAMNWREVTVVAVLQGVDAKGAAAPIYATVIGLGTKEGRHQPILQTLYFDQGYGWFWYETADKFVRIWTKAGYQEIRPWTT